MDPYTSQKRINRYRVPAGGRRYRTVPASRWRGVDRNRLLAGCAAGRHIDQIRRLITIRRPRDADLGNRTLVFRRMDRRPFGGILGGLGIFSDSHVRYILSKSSTCWRTIGANGTGIEVLGCSYCTVSFLGLRTEFPIIICNLATGTDTIIGTDVLGSVLPHTLDIKNGLLFAQGGASLQLHRKDSALYGRVFTVGHSSIPPYSEAVLHCSVRTTGGGRWKAGRERLFLSYHASLYGGHLGRTRTLARLADRLYWSGMSDDVRIGWANVWRVSSGNLRWVATTHWAIFPPVTAGIE